jgi:hypothetical protein
VIEQWRQCVGNSKRGVPAHRVYQEKVFMTTVEHLDAYLIAMGNRDVEGTKVHMADNVVLRSPIVPAPFVGKERVADVLTQLLATVDAFEPKLLLRDGADFVAVSTLRPGDQVLDGKDHKRRLYSVTSHPIVKDERSIFGLSGHSRKSD